MTAVHVQLREDAELGRAWRRCEAALPSDGFSPDARLFLDRTSRGHYEAVVRQYRRSGPTPTDALNALADALEARRAAE